MNQSVFTNPILILQFVKKKIWNTAMGELKVICPSKSNQGFSNKRVASKFLFLIDKPASRKARILNYP